MKTVQNAMWFSYVLVSLITKHKWHCNCCPINPTLASLALLVLLSRSCFCCCVHLCWARSGPFSIPLHFPVKPDLERKVDTERPWGCKRLCSCLTLVKPLTVFPAHTFAIKHSHCQTVYYLQHAKMSRWSLRCLCCCINDTYRVVMIFWCMWH